jgi:Protein of unknown function (DUF2637)
MSGTHLPSLKNLASLSWVAVVAVALALSNYSLYIFGAHNGLPGYLAWMLSVPFDGACLVAGNLTLKYARELGSNGFGPRLAVVILCGLSAWLNTEHASFLHLGAPGHVMYACPPIVSIALFELSIRFEYRQALDRAGRTVKPLPVFGFIVWALHSVTAYRAVREIAAARLAAATGAELQRLGAAARPVESHRGDAPPRPRSRQGDSDTRPAGPGSHPDVADSHPRNAPDSADSGITAPVSLPWDALASAQTKTEAIRVALAECGEVSAPEVVSWLYERGWNVNAALVRSVRSRDNGTPGASRRESGAAAVTPSAARV